MNPVVLLLVFHNHQPGGNFPDVIERAYQQSYLPMLEALSQHPAIAVGLHYSGSLLEWLEGAHPEFFSKLHPLIRRGQVEMLTGGYYEPILACIPERDQRGQILKLTRYLQQRFQATPQGLWLAERVWEPHLAQSISDAGVAYTIVDDSHFFAVGLQEAELRSYYLTEDGGATLKIFPSRRSLRYLIPWHSPEDVLAYLRTFQGTGRLLMMGDDGEKFGMWPGTHTLCWEQGWVERFFQALEGAADWLMFQRPADAVASQPPAGRIYLPTASYDEMSEWALPAERAVEFTKAKERLTSAHDPAAAFLRGGFWRHFLVKYPEINTMHKKMLRVSTKIQTLRAGKTKQYALDELWQGQANCPYWHGVFGGIYLPHIRAANFAHLIAADVLATPQHSPPQGAVDDLDRDGLPEVELRSPSMTMTIDPGDGGSVVEWDWHERRVNLVNVMTRRPEAYHRRLQEAARAASVPPGDGSVDSIHTTRLRTKEPGLDRLLVYDSYRRASFIDHVFPDEVSIDDYARGGYEEGGDFVIGAYASDLQSDMDTVQLRVVRDGHISVRGTRAPLRIEKRYRLFRHRSQLEVAYRLQTSGQSPLRFILGVESNWAVTDPGAAMSLNDHRGTVRDYRALTDITELRFQDVGWAGPVRVDLSVPAWVGHFPLEAVSNSEAGFERTFQGMSVLCQYLVTIDPAQVWEANFLSVLPTTP